MQRWDPIPGQVRLNNLVLCFEVFHCSPLLFPKGASIHAACWLSWRVACLHYDPVCQGAGVGAGGCTLKYLVGLSAACSSPGRNRGATQTTLRQVRYAYFILFFRHGNRTPARSRAISRVRRVNTSPAPRPTTPTKEVDTILCSAMDNNVVSASGSISLRDFGRRAVLYGAVRQSCEQKRLSRCKLWPGCASRLGCRRYDPET